MLIEKDKIYNMDCAEGMRNMPDNSVDLTVTSPPYDDLRTYGGTCEWNFDIFKPIAQELYRVTKPGGVVVWVVNDAVKDGSESGTSFKQALYFMECGFKLHDTMIYEKNSTAYPAQLTGQRYSQIFEYMFVFVKGKIRKDIRLIADKRNKWAGWTNWGQHTTYDKDGNLNKTTSIKPISEYSLRNNIWKYSVSFNDKTGHPAVFPEKLAEDHILSWSREGDIVLDPFMGSGTTAKMAMLNGRHFIGFEKNLKYYEESLNRIGNFCRLMHEENYKEQEITLSNGETGTALIDSSGDSEIVKKTILFNSLISQLNDYFNEQGVETLKTLQLTFASSTNGKRVNKVMGEKKQNEEITENNLFNDGYQSNA